VLYELHVGTFTPEGTWAAAAEQLAFLAEVGITTLEVMPVSDFPGEHNWGYDGVNPFAPSRCYGRPEDMRRFVDRAHACGLAVILDVVYNHFGPSGNAMFDWCPYYKGDQATEWGEALDFDGPHSAPVREYFVTNAGYWIDEFHLDGLRIDATQAIHDRSPEHVLHAIARRAREAGRGRHIFLVGENEPQDAGLLGDAAGLDALWNDDFHHTARVALTGVIEGYLHDYRGTPQELVSAVERGFLYQGQLYPWQRNPRGTPSRGIARSRFVHFLENHDQAANLGFGERLAAICQPAQLRALTALLLLSPELPMLFQSQETGSRRPWRFFVDHRDELRAPIRKGRAEFCAQFPRLATPEAQAALADPCDHATFTACKLDPAERSLENPWVRLHRDLLRLRRDDPAFTDPRPDAVDGAVLGPHTFALRFWQPDPAADRLLVVNLGPTFAQAVVPEPLIAPPAGTGWQLAWSTEHPRCGGHGTPRVFDRARLAIPAHAAVLLVPDPGASLRLVPPPPSGDHDPVEP
jgi:maltooligosyltrehalose trehalohydrolase